MQYGCYLLSSTKLFPLYARNNNIDLAIYDWRKFYKHTVQLRSLELACLVCSIYIRPVVRKPVLDFCNLVVLKY